MHLRCSHFTVCTNALSVNETGFCEIPENHPIAFLDESYIQDSLSLFDIWKILIVEEAFFTQNNVIKKKNSYNL